VRAGLITQDQLLECLDEQQKYMREGGEIPRIGDVMCGKGYVTQDQLESLMTRQADAEPAPEELPSEVQSIGGYALITKVGADAYGPVYKARNEKTGDIVTLKIMSQSVMQTPEFKDQFIEVTRRGAVLNHPNIRRVHTVGTSKGHFFYTSQWVEGTSLRQILTERGKLGIQPATRMALSLTKALRFGHERGIVHGDLRPSNIIITINGDVKIAEFGVLKDTLGNLNRLLNTASSVGFYISPEQVVGDRTVDERADIYSLGAVFYHMLTGRPPFEGDSPLKSLTRLSQEDFQAPSEVLPEIPAELSEIVEKMLEVEPDYRYQRMSEVEDVLEQVLRSGLIAEAQAAVEAAAKAAAPVAPAAAAGMIGTGAVGTTASVGGGARASSRLGGGSARVSSSSMEDKERDRGARSARLRAHSGAQNKWGIIGVVGIGLAGIIFILILVSARAKEEERRLEERRRAAQPAIPTPKMTLPDRSTTATRSDTPTFKRRDGEEEEVTPTGSLMLRDKAPAPKPATSDVRIERKERPPARERERAAVEMRKPSQPADEGQRVRDTRFGSGGSLFAPPGWKAPHPTDTVKKEEEEKNE
jgi:hypothetical protein